MVERDIYLDDLFGSLADPVRRDILQRPINARQTISQLAENYEISFAAVVKQRRGKERIVSIAPGALKDANQYLARYEVLWNQRFDVLDNILKEDI